MLLAADIEQLTVNEVKYNKFNTSSPGLNLLFKSIYPNLKNQEKLDVSSKFWLFFTFQRGPEPFDSIFSANFNVSWI